MLVIDESKHFNVFSSFFPIFFRLSISGFRFLQKSVL